MLVAPLIPNNDTIAVDLVSYGGYEGKGTRVWKSENIDPMLKKMFGADIESAVVDEMMAAADTDGGGASIA